MGSKSASLLTKKQRSRIREGFADLDEEKTRRDQGRIRERLRAGLSDFGVLVDYPDRQLALAFEDVPDDELREALADATLFLERVRELEGYDRDDVLVRARGRAEEATNEAGDVESLRRLDIETGAEIRREAESAAQERLGPDRWERRVNGALKLAGGAALPLFAIFTADWLTESDLLGESALAGGSALLLMFLIFAALSVVLFIKGLQALKHNVIPAVRRFAGDPAGSLRGLLGWLRRPGQRVREFWESL